MARAKVSRTESKTHRPRKAVQVSSAAESSPHPPASMDTPNPAVHPAAESAMPGELEARPNGSAKISMSDKQNASLLQPQDRSTELGEKVKDLLRLAQEQGYLTYTDLNEALPHTLVTPEDLDEIYIKLRNLEIDIVDQA